VEIWGPARESGIEDYHFIEWYREHSADDDLKLLAWSDRELEGEAHIDWYKFDHPQLGPVELGGWNRLACFRNPPKKFLEREVKRFPKWLTWQALTTPKLELLRSRGDAARRRRLEGAPRGAQHGIPPDLCHPARARPQGHARRRLRDRPSGRAPRSPRARRASKARSSTAARTRSRCNRSRSTRRSPAIAGSASGPCALRREPRSGSSRATIARASSARRSCSG
jgi:hypothetical protein